VAFITYAASLFDPIQQFASIFADFQSAQASAERVIGLIDAIRQQTPSTKLYVESLLPINEKSGRWRTLAGRTNDIPLTNMYIRAYCESNGITFVDLFHQMTYPKSNMLRDELSSDGLHITEAGYEIWAKEILLQLNHQGR
jgi:lysophospholipase L1-like esterase